MTNKRNSRRKDCERVKRILPQPSTAQLLDAAEILEADFARRRAFDAIADFFARLNQRPFTISQAVSIARALQPYAEQEGARRQAHGATAPGRQGKALKTSERFKARDFVARCVGLAPHTLRKAEMVVEAAERSPQSSYYRKHVMSMDETRKVGPAFYSLTVRPNQPPLGNGYRQLPADREFGERFVRGLIEQALGNLVEITTLPQSVRKSRRAKGLLKLPSATARKSGARNV